MTQMRYLVVKNWQAYQHYKKRNPPWIKLHRAIVDDYHFAALKDKTKAHLMMIWIIAAGTEGRIPHDAKFIGARINATEPVDLDAIIEAGFLVAEDGAEAPQPAEKKPRANGSKDPAAFALPDWIDAELWAAWVEVRTKKRAPNTRRALELSVKQLQKIGGDHRAVLEQSVRNGYQGLWQVKYDSAGKPDYSEVLKRIQADHDAT